MKYINIVSLLFFSTVFSSCLNQKYLQKNQTIFRVDTVGMNSEIRVYSNGNNKMKVSVEESNGSLYIKKASTETNNFSVVDTIKRNFYPSGSFYSQLELNGKFYFAETTFPKNGDPNSNHNFISPSSLKYSENKIVLQALSIPLKIRSAIKNDRYKDSLPTQVETGFNAGFALGLKRTWSVFKPELNMFGQNTTKFSAASGILFNIGGADVKKSTTNYTIVVDRKEPFYSYGMFFLLGVNNINIGYSFGSDHLFSKNNKNWVYRGKLWHGVTVALDILK
jgi:hypothetical protein